MSLKQLPILKDVLKFRYRRYFAAQRDTNLFYGVYPTFAAATADMPKTKPGGYDNPEPAGMYGERLNRVFLADYPLLYWLRPILPEVGRLYDFGGHVGIAFYAYQRYLEFPKALKWEVYDVPAVRDAGAKLAKERGATQLSFSSTVADADGADVFMASGSLQYVESPDIAATLSQFQKKPKHLFINKTPLHDSETFVTLQNIGTAFCPYKIFKRGDFVRSIETLGYEQIDAWQSWGACPIPYHPRHSVHEYSGLYFRRRG